MAKRIDKVDHSIFWNLWGEDQLKVFLIGHLAIESVILQLISCALKKPDKLNSKSLRFPQKIQLCQSLGLINDDFSDLLIKLNQYRNKYAHRINYKISFDEAHALVELAGKSGVEFTDDLDKSKKFAKSVHDDASGLLIEVLSNTFFQLAIILDENGGEFLMG